MIAAMKTLSAQYPRYGYRRIRIFLRRQGHQLGVHRTHRLWRQAGLQLPRRSARAGASPPAVRGRCRQSTPTSSGPTTSCSTPRANGQQIKCLTVVDEFTHECLAIDVAGSIRSKRVIEVLCASRSARTARRSSCARTTGRSSSATPSSSGSPRAGIATALIDPGKPWQNGTNESFNGKLRDECLSVEWFRIARRGQGRHRGLAPSLQRRPTAQQPELLDAARVQAAASPHPQPSRPPGMIGPKKPGQVTLHRSRSVGPSLE